MAERPPAGQRQQGQDNSARLNNTWKSSIFNNDPAPTPTPAKRSQPEASMRSNSGGFESRPQQPRTNNSFKSTIFGSSEAQPLQATQSRDHGKEYLFGVQVNDDHKSSIKRVSTSDRFEPKNNSYDPQQTKHNQLHNTEIAREHIPLQVTGKVNRLQPQTQKRSSVADPAERKQLENSSNIFGVADSQNNQIQKRLKEQLTTTKNNETIDPARFAKVKKGREQASDVFGNGKTIQNIPIPVPSTDEQFNKLKVRNPNLSEVFGQPPTDLVQTQRPPKIQPANTNYYELDSVKHLKDYAPEKDHQTVEGEADKLNTQQKMFQTLKSSMDQHGYDYTEYTEKNQRISVKSQKYKPDIINPQQKQPKQQKQLVKKRKQSQGSII